MRSFDAATQAALESGQGVVPRHLVWVTAKNRGTGADEVAGFWNGKDVRNFIVDSVARTYFGAGSLLGIDNIVGSVGLSVRMQTVKMSSLAPEVLQAIRGYDLRFAPVEIHRVLFDPQKGVQIGDAIRVFKGTVDEAPIPRAAPGQSAPLDLTLASAARSLTRTLTVKKSDAAQRKVDPTDEGRAYAAISGAVGVFWGVKNKRGAPPPTPNVLS